MSDILNLRGTVDALKRKNEEEKNIISWMDSAVRRISALDTQGLDGLVIKTVTMSDMDLQIIFNSSCPEEKHYHDRIVDALKELMASRLKRYHEKLEKIGTDAGEQE